MGVYQKKCSKNLWITYTDEVGKRRRKSTRTTDRKMAEIILGRVQLSVMKRREGLDAADPIESRRALEQHVAAYEIANRRDLDPKYTYEALRTVRAAVEHGRWGVAADITPESVDRFLEDLNGGKCSPKYHNHCLAHLTKFCDWLMKRRPPVLLINPTECVDRRPVLDSEYRTFLTDDEIDALRTAPNPKRLAPHLWSLDKLFFDMAIEAGLRGGEAKLVKVGNVHLDCVRPFLSLPATDTKSKRFETVPMTDYLIERIEPFVRGRMPSMGLFETQYQGKQIVRRTSVRIMQSALTSMGVPLHDHNGAVKDIHGLRHTCVRLCGRSGMGPKETMVFCRLRSLHLVTRVYDRIGLAELNEGVTKRNTYAEKRVV